MGRKSRHLVVLKPFCYYCDKEFNNEIILHQHQKARHFNCQECKKRFSTAPALDTHMVQVHKIKLQRVPNAKSGRDSFEISIYGMDGVPLELLNYKLAEKVQNKRRKLIKEKKILANDDDLKSLNTKRKNKKQKEREKELDIAKLLRNNNGTNSGFYHNPDSINLTLKENQMNQMYVNMNNPLLNTLGFGYFNGIQNSLTNFSSPPPMSAPNGNQQIPMILGMPFNNFGMPPVINNIVPVNQTAPIIPPSNVNNTNPINIPLPTPNPIISNSNEKKDEIEEDDIKVEDLNSQP